MAGPRDAAKNPWKNRKESKSREISRLLTHRAQLRKKYFKMMEKENGEEYHEEPKNSDKKEKPKLNFAERSKIAKERKERQRQAKLQGIKEQRESVEKKRKERDNKKTVISQRTRKGQPLMGPRINTLLEKIKENK